MYLKRRPPTSSQSQSSSPLKYRDALTLKLTVRWETRAHLTNQLLLFHHVTTFSERWCGRQHDQDAEYRGMTSSTST